VGQGPVRTGVTVVVPHEQIGDSPVFAGTHTLNGNGEMTGLEWVRESGHLSTPVAITNTHSVGVVRDALVAADMAHHDARGSWWSLPVVAETYDGALNDINGMHVTAAHVRAALAGTSDGAEPEGNVGGGTGMICHEFKGGTGTASRVVNGWTVGALVQSNYGDRERLGRRIVGRRERAGRLPRPVEARFDGLGIEGLVEHGKSGGAEDRRRRVLARFPIEREAAWRAVPAVVA